MTINRSIFPGRFSLFALISVALLATGCGRSTVWYGEIADSGPNPGKEICTNGIDDDGDGFIDCQDLDCKGHPTCSSKPEICTNPNDEEREGLMDCNYNDSNNKRSQ